MILASNEGKCESKRFSVNSKTLDLVNANEEDFLNLFGDQDPAEHFKQVVIVHNAGKKSGGCL